MKLDTDEVEYYSKNHNLLLSRFFALVVLNFYCFYYIDILPKLVLPVTQHKEDVPVIKRLV